MVFNVGNTLNRKLIKYLSGIFSAVEGKWGFLYSSYCVLYNVEGDEKDEERINFYFQYALSKKRVEIDNNMTMILDTRIPLSHDSIQCLFMMGGYTPLAGNWDCVALVKDGILRVSKMEIVNQNNIIYKGVAFSNYLGRLEIKGDDLYIYLEGGRKNAVFVSNLSYIEETSITAILAGFITASPYERGVVSGTMFLIKETSNLYKNIPFGEYPPESEVFKMYEETGIIQELKSTYVQNKIKT